MYQMSYYPYFYPPFLVTMHPHLWMEDNVKMEEPQPQQEVKVEVQVQTWKNKKQHYKQGLAKLVKQNRKVVRDEEWSLTDQKTKKTCTNIQQKQGRNAASNIFRSFIKFLKTKQAQNLSQQLNKICVISINLKDLLLWLQQKAITYKNYIKQQRIYQIIKEQIEDRGGQLATLFLNFLRKYVRSHFMTSQKLIKKNIQFTLKTIRQVEERIASIIRN